MKMSPPPLPALSLRIVTGGGLSAVAEAGFVAADAAGAAAAVAMAPISTPITQVFLRIVALLPSPVDPCKRRHYIDLFSRKLAGPVLGFGGGGCTDVLHDDDARCVRF